MPRPDPQGITTTGSLALQTGSVEDLEEAASNQPEVEKDESEVEE